MEATDIIRRNFVRYLVQKTIFCPITQVILDFRTCVVINDPDGMPHAVISQEAYQRMLDTGVSPDKFFQDGYSVDQSTIKV